jgi:hypothetical protein
VALFSSLFDKMSHFGSDPSLTQLRLPIKTKKGTKPMAIKPALTDLDITTADSGYYEGFSKFVSIGSKAAIGALIVWAIAFPEGAGAVLSSIRATIDANTGPWYMYVVSFYIIVCLVLALVPSTGRIRLGGDDSRP